VKLRLFVALDLPAPAREALAAFRAAAADPAVWRPLADDALHLTLAFLGHRPEADVSAIVDGLSRVPHAAPRLRLGPALALPPRRPRVLTAEIEDPDGTLGALQAAVSGELAARGLYEPETRPYRPHATVARLRPDARASRETLPAPSGLQFHGEALTLYQSRLRREGARYEALARFPLAL
jgi:RNA 2',3'-cyclic 3'-phosphodiesterase